MAGPLRTPTGFGQAEEIEASAPTTVDRTAAAVQTPIAAKTLAQRIKPTGAPPFETPGLLNTQASINRLVAKIANLRSSQASDGPALPNPTPYTAPVLNRINTGNSPHGIAIDGQGVYAYIANEGSNSVSVIDINTNKKVKDILIPPSIGLGPAQLTISPDGKNLYVLNKTQSPSPIPFTPPRPPSVAIVDLTTGKIEKFDITTLGIAARIPNFLGPNVTGIALDANLSEIYVTDSTTSTPSFSSIVKSRWQLMDVSERLMSDIRECTSPRCPVYNVSEDFSTWKSVYLSKTTAFKAMQLAIDKLLKGTISLKGLQAQPNAIAVAPSEGGGYIYSINSGNGFAYVFDPYRKVMVDAVFLGTMSADNNILAVNDDNIPTAIKFSPNGKTAYVPNMGSGEVAVLNTDPNRFSFGGGPSVTARITIGGEDGSLRPVDIAVSPDGKYGYVVSNIIDLKNPSRVGAPMLTVLDLATNSVLGQPVALGADAKIIATQIAVTNNKAIITTQQRPGTWASILATLTRKDSDVLVVDLAKLRTDLGPAT
jgi:YVTN family beta-propeller protein